MNGLGVFSGLDVVEHVEGLVKGQHVGGEGFEGGFIEAEVHVLVGGHIPNVHHDLDRFLGTRAFIEVEEFAGCYPWGLS